MKVTFREHALEEIYETGKTRDRKYKDFCKNRKLVAGYQRAVSLMYDASSTAELRVFSFLHYEKLRHQGCEPRSSVRVQNGFVERLVFIESEDGIEVELLEIDNTHYGNKK